jgi:hypothetical protein
MEKEFVNYEQALALKELGFDEKCIAKYTIVPEDDINWFSIAEQTISDGKQLFGGSKNYNTKLYNDEGTISAPLKQQVFRWFREKYDAHIHPRRIMPNVYIAEYGLWASKSFDTYEEAENACIDKLIELAKQQGND